MNYFDERKKNLFSNDKLDCANFAIKQNISLRKKDIKNKIFNQRLNYTNNNFQNKLFVIDPNILQINEEEKNYEFKEMVYFLNIFIK
jgi:hypothetical protein